MNNKQKPPKILAYHSVGAKGNGEVGSELYSVSETNFKEQMEYLVDRRLQTIDHRPILTFDDGDITNYRCAYPILKELKLSAYFFIIASKVGIRGYMNWEEIRSLRDSGMIIGSHGMNHKILTGLGEVKLDYELRASKKFLEDNLLQSIVFFSIPRGFYNEKVIDKAKEIGYKAVFTSNIKDSDGFRFGRIPVRADWDLKRFARIINNGYSVKDKAGELIKNSSKKVLGAKYYDIVRTKILR